MSKENGKSATPQLAQVDIGALLANKRKNKNISLERAATTINLPKHIVEKLENNDFSSIGAPVYVRGYLSLYAKYLGFDVAEVVQLYNTQYPNDNVTLRSALPPLKGMVKKERKRHSKTVSLLVSLLFLGILLYAYYRIEPLFFNKIMGQAGMEQSATSQVVESDVIANNLIDETENVQNLAGDVLNGQSITNTTDLVSDVDVNTIELESTVGTDDTDTVPQSTLETSETTPVIEVEQAPKVTLENLSLTMTFNDDCWLKITDADGKVVASGVYTAKKPLKVQGKLPMKLNTARASVIKSVMLGDKEISLESNRLSKRRFEIK